MTPLETATIVHWLTTNLTHIIDDLLGSSIHFLTRTPEPLVEFARAGVAVGIIAFLTGVIVRFVLSPTGSFDVDALEIEHKWSHHDTVRAGAALIGLVIYYYQIDTAYSLLNMALTPLGSSEALIAAVPIGPELSVAPLLTVLVLFLFVELSLIILVFDSLRLLGMVAVFPVIVPLLTVGTVLRIPRLTGWCRSLLHRIRWFIYAGFVAALVIQSGSLTVAALPASFEVLRIVLVALTLHLTVYGVMKTISHGPTIDKIIDRWLQRQLPVPDGTGGDSDRDTTAGKSEETVDRS